MDYPPCKTCGTKHGMGMENMQTGEITPIDVCKTCLFRSVSSIKTGFETGLTRDERFLINKIISEKIQKMDDREV